MAIDSETYGETELRVGLARRSFPYYCAYVHQRPLYRHQEVWVETWQGPSGGRTLIVSPPETFKSTLLRMLTEWEIGRDTNLCTLLTMNTASQSQKQVMSIAETIDNNPRYRQVFPHVVANPARGWSHEALFVHRKDEARPDPTIYGTGIDGPYQGSHVDRLIMDDLTDQQDVYSAATMEAQRQRLRGVLLDRVIEGGKIYAILTRWGLNDLVPVYREMGFTVMENPVRGTYPWGPLLCPEVFSEERMARLLSDKGQSLYDMTYGCDPASAAKERSFFDPTTTTSMLAYDCMDPRERRLGVVSIWRPPVVAGQYVGFGDVAWGQKGAYSCFVLADYVTGEQVAEIHGRPNLDESAQLIFDLAESYNRAYIGIEANGEGRRVVDKLIELGYGDRMFHRAEDWRTRNDQRGYLTSASTRPVMLAELEEAVRMRRIIVRCKEGVGEFMSFIRDEHQRPVHADGAYDDHVMAWAGLWQVRQVSKFARASHKPIRIHRAWA